MLLVELDEVVVVGTTVVGCGGGVEEVVVFSLLVLLVVVVAGVCAGRVVLTQAGGGRACAGFPIEAARMKRLHISIGLSSPNTVPSPGMFSMGSMVRPLSLL